MEYLKPSFSVHVGGSKQYADNWHEIYGCKASFISTEPSRCELRRRHDGLHVCGDVMWADEEMR